LGHLHAAHLVSQVSRNFPGNFPEASRKGLAEAAEGRRPDRRRDRESAQETGGLAAGWAYLARSLTAASTAFFPSGLEFETRDGSRCGAVATGRHSLDGAKTVGLCSLPEMPCALLLLLALPQRSNPAHIHHAAARSSPSLAVTAAPGDCICTRPRVGRKCPLQAACRSDSEALPCLLHCACLHQPCQGLAAQCGLQWTLQGRPSPGLQSPANGLSQHVRQQVCSRCCATKTALHWLKLQTASDMHLKLLSGPSKAVRGHSDCNCWDQIASRGH
jgi:hypothetical protein